MSSDGAHCRPGDAGVRGTRQRAALTALLKNLDEFRSAQDLHYELRGGGEGVGLTTVYRTLQQMAGDGLVDTMRTHTGEVRYRWCSTGLHHHLVCRRCGSAVEVRATQVEQWATQVGHANGFSDVIPTIEVVGTCARCSGR